MALNVNGIEYYGLNTECSKPFLFRGDLLSTALFSKSAAISNLGSE